MNKEIDETKLTAYALGELDASERAAIEARLAIDPAAREEVAQIRGVATALKAQLAAEPMPEAAEPLRLDYAPQRRRRRWTRWAIAAAVTMAIGTSYVMIERAR